MSKVAHVMRFYLGQSETFIWQYLSNFSRFIPVVLAPNLLNLDQFPLNHGHIIAVYGPRGSFPWFIDNWYRRVLMRPQGYAAKIIRRKKIILIHAHFAPMGFAYLPVSLSMDIPLITSFYGYDLSDRNFLQEHKDKYQKLFRHGHFFLVEGPSMQDRLLSLGCPEERIVIQRIALDLSGYQFSPPSWDGIRPIRLLFVGRFVEKKGLEYALRALANLRNDYSFQLRIIGDGELNDHLRALASSLGVSQQIAWLGMQPHRRVIQELQSCDILLQPSVTAINGDSEGGAPTIILEAQATGVPVVATIHADIPYITRPNESALLSPERHVNSLTENISHLFDNPEIWPRMGTTGRQHVEAFHDITTEVFDLEKLYDNCLNRSTH